LVRRFLEAQANADPDALEELLTPDFVDHIASNLIKSLAERASYARSQRTIVINRVSGAKIVEEWSESTGVLEATRQRLEQEKIERERIESRSYS
jgi:hypothetical protein